MKLNENIIFAMINMVFTKDQIKTALGLLVRIVPTGRTTLKSDWTKHHSLSNLKVYLLLKQGSTTWIKLLLGGTSPTQTAHIWFKKCRKIWPLNRQLEMLNLDLSTKIGLSGQMELIRLKQVSNITTVKWHLLNMRWITRLSSIHIKWVQAADSKICWQPKKTRGIEKMPNIWSMTRQIWNVLVVHVKWEHSPCYFM